MKTYIYICRLTNSIEFAVQANHRSEADQKAQNLLDAAQKAGNMFLPALRTFEVFEK